MPALIPTSTIKHLKQDLKLNWFGNIPATFGLRGKYRTSSSPPVHLPASLSSTHRREHSSSSQEARWQLHINNNNSLTEPNQTSPSPFAASAAPRQAQPSDNDTTITGSPPNTT